MQNFLLIAIASFLCLSIKAQSVQLDSMISFRDSLSEIPAVKHIYQYNDEGVHTKTISWSTIISGGIEEFKLSEIDSFIYNDQGLLSEMQRYSHDNGENMESGRSLYEYDDDGNNILYLIQVKNNAGNDWVGLWKSEFTYANGLPIESFLYFRNPAIGIWTPSSREEYIYDPVTDQLIQRNGFSYDFSTLVEEPLSMDLYFYDEDGFEEESENYRYDKDEASFYLFSIRKNTKDEFGNNIHSLSTRVDSNGVETPSYMSDKIYDTNIEVSDVNFPATSSASSRSEHILLHSSNIFWEEDEWVLNSNFVYYYSGVTGTDDISKVEELKIFPNPVSTTINFSNHEILEGSNTVFQITRSDGGLIYKGKLNQNHFDVSTITPGVYTVTLQNGNSIFKGKFIKI